MKDYFFSARNPEEDVNAEDEMGLNKHLRIMIRYVFPPGIRSWWWRRPWYIWKELGAYGEWDGGGSKLSRRAVFSMQKVFKSDALGDDWPRRSVDLPLIGAAREE
ncbi:hypothetical protein AMECASPLE_027012 [Ameca splendens]|uniref:Uncharacterized protein n=1 Tax=Ameca splendens TaxID=208324 RepID=A0ABV0XI21_9TELE